MKALGNFFLGNGKFEMREFDLPALGSHDVLIRNKAAGICGTDVHIYLGEKGSAEVTPPVVLGHEYAGVVEAVGGDVTTVKVGDHVTVDPNSYCGICHFCRNGQKQLCDSLYAVGVNRNGGFATHSVVPQAQVFAVNPAVGFEGMSMTEPLACCIHGLDQIGLRSGDTVCVVGGGAIGLLMVQLALTYGASRVYLSEPVAWRRAIGLKLGAAAAIDPYAGDPAEQLRALTGRGGADVVIECVGVVAATRQAVAMADKGGRVLLFSVPQVDAAYDLPLFDVFKKELRIFGSLINPDSHAQAVNLLSSGRVQTGDIITHRFPLDKLEDAIRMQMSDASLKVLVTP